MAGLESRLLRGSLAPAVPRGLSVARQAHPAVRLEPGALRDGTDRNPLHRRAPPASGLAEAGAGPAGAGQGAARPRTGSEEPEALPDPRVRIFRGARLSLPGDGLGFGGGRMARRGSRQLLPAAVHGSGGEEPDAGRSRRRDPAADRRIAAGRAYVPGRRGTAQEIGLRGNRRGKAPRRRAAGQGRAGLSGSRSHGASGRGEGSGLEASGPGRARAVGPRIAGIAALRRRAICRGAARGSRAGAPLSGGSGEKASLRFRSLPALRSGRAAAPRRPGASARGPGPSGRGPASGSLPDPPGPARSDAWRSRSRAGSPGA